MGIGFYGVTVVRVVTRTRTMYSRPSIGIENPFRVYIRFLIYRKRPRLMSPIDISLRRYFHDVREINSKKFERQCYPCYTDTLLKLLQQKRTIKCTISLDARDTVEREN